MKLNSMLRKTFLNEHHLNTVQPLVKKCDCFLYRATLINKGIFLRQKNSFAKSQNITKAATLEHFLCGFVRTFQNKIECACVKNF